MMEIQPFRIWIVCSDYFDIGNPAREYLKEKFKPQLDAGVLEVKLLRREDHVTEWTKLGIYPDVVVTNGTYQIKDGEGFDDVSYDPKSEFPAKSGTKIFSFHDLEYITLQ